MSQTDSPFQQNDMMGYNCRVLIVDDNRDLVEAVEDVLNKHGFPTFAAFDHRQALARFEEHRPEIALVNIGLQPTSGLELIKVLTHDHPQVARIVMSGQSTRDVAVDAIRAGADDFLGKPIRAQDLLEAMQRAVATHASRRLSVGASLKDRRSEVIAQLTGGIAHDFNNILAVILGNATLLQTGNTNNPEEAESIEAIRLAALKGRDLTQKLLGYTGQQPLRPISVDLASMLRDPSGPIRQVVGTDVSLDIDSAPTTWNVDADPHHLSSAIICLAANAMDAMAAGGRLEIGTQNVTVPATGDGDADLGAGDYVAITMTDNGTGMAPEVLAKAFDPYFTTKAMGEGRGLGLSMVYGFAKQSGGAVTLHSRLGTGTKVTLYLPRATAASTAKPYAGRIALLVEDDAECRRVTSKLLGCLGYQVVEAEDADQGLRALDCLPRVDFLLSDIALPGDMDGSQMLAAAKRRRPSIKTMLMSGYPELVSANENCPDVDLGLLQKPFRREDLAERLGFAG